MESKRKLRCGSISDIKYAYVRQRRPQFAAVNLAQYSEYGRGITSRVDADLERVACFQVTEVAV